MQTYTEKTITKNDFTVVKAINKSNKYLVTMAIDILTADNDWIAADDNEIVILKFGHDYVAIHAAYEGEGTEFRSTLDVMVTLESTKWGIQFARIAE